ncbi:kinase [Micromonospora zingiberis]|uniref:kinase n=1 Tax=Micromonospora zingiberis TaxID=2053011 RepID=UPI0019817A84|nr:kinase [Micromonospora zingiberis]
MTPGVILYGPPAAGKDTVTQELVKLRNDYAPFRRIKVGRGRTVGYRMATDADIERLRANGDVLWENERYGSTYIVDYRALADELSRHIPVLHLGQPDGIDAVRGAFPPGSWIVVYIWSSRSVAAERIEARRTGDTAERLAAWDATPRVKADLEINTGRLSAEQAAQRIDVAIRKYGLLPPASPVPLDSE